MSGSTRLKTVPIAETARALLTPDTRTDDTGYDTLAHTHGVGSADSECLVFGRNLQSFR